MVPRVFMRKVEQIKRKWVYLPIEVKSRELAAKLFFCAKAIQEGFGIFLGRNGMNISRDYFPRGIYFDKCLSNHKITFHEYQVNTLGNRLVSLDEEGLLMGSEQVYVKERVSQTSIDLSDLIFLWGKNQEQVIRKNYAVTNKLFITGSPRIDIWRPEFIPLYQTKIHELQKRYGNYILVVSNWGFSYTDKIHGLDPHKVYAGDLKSHIRSNFISLISELSNALPERTLVVRPHPVDLPEYWEKVEKKFPKNVKVIYEGPISPWIHSASAVIHNDCTTGLEAWVGKASVFAYYPIFDEFEEYATYTMPINQLAVVCRTTAEIITKVAESFSESSKFNNDANVDVVRKFIRIEEEKYASDFIVEKLQEVNISEEEYQIPKFNSFKKLRGFWGSLKWLARDYLGKSGMYTHSYTQQKNPGLEIEEITDFLKQFAPIVGIDENFFQVREIDKDTFCIFGEKGIEQHK
jgi:surface carbohydrate biosynthesis protein